jgi:hypothetical protein
MEADPASIAPMQFSFIKAFDSAPYFCRAQQQTVGEQEMSHGRLAQGERRPAIHDSAHFCRYFFRADLWTPF